MKLATNSLNSIKHLLGKILFSSQIVIITAGVPVLYCVGVSHNAKHGSKVSIVKTNKGKTIMELTDADNTSIPYPSVK